jgi:hypothetical protein
VGSTVPFLEHGARYMIKCVQKIQREWLKSMVPKSVIPLHLQQQRVLRLIVTTYRRSSVKLFNKHVDEFLDPTIFNANVSTLSLRPEKTREFNVLNDNNLTVPVSSLVEAPNERAYSRFVAWLGFTRTLQLERAQMGRLRLRV